MYILILQTPDFNIHFVLIIPTVKSIRSYEREIYIDGKWPEVSVF